MTREKLTALRHILQRLEEEYKNYLAHGETNTQAIETEIEAVKEAISALSTEPCEDAVSRARVLSMAITHQYNTKQASIIFKDDVIKNWDDMIDFVETLPPVQPKIPYPSYCGEDERK